MMMIARTASSGSIRPVDEVYNVKLLALKYERNGIQREARSVRI